jgi:hypothetical protein
MTFAQFKDRVARGVMRDDLIPLYGDFVNEALREVQNRAPWSFSRRTVNLSVPAGSGRETVALPADFKELQKLPAVHYVTDEGDLIPADVVTEEQQLFRIWAFGGTPITTWPPRVFLDRRAEGAVLGVVEPMTQPFTFRVKYIAYAPVLSVDSDTSPLIDAYPAMMLAKAKAIAFSQINDPQEAACEVAYEKAYSEARRQDAYSEVSGRVTRM